MRRPSSAEGQRFAAAKRSVATAPHGRLRMRGGGARAAVMTDHRGWCPQEAWRGALCRSLGTSITAKNRPLRVDRARPLEEPTPFFSRRYL